jgi:hypothetical protein
MWKYGFGRWTMMLDADEFVVLPQGVTVQDLEKRVHELDRGSILGVMLDVYPSNIVDLQDVSDFQPSSQWFFDGQQHLRLRQGGSHAHLYPGARARLLAKYGLRKLSLRLRVRNVVKKPWFPGFNLNSKAIFHRWGESDLFLNSHKTTSPVNDRILLPIRHYKFNSDVYRRVEIALAEKRYAGGSVEYQSISELLLRMKMRNGSFLYRYSRSANDFDAFLDTGNAIL